MRIAVPVVAVAVVAVACSSHGGGGGSTPTPTPTLSPTPTPTPGPHPVGRVFTIILSNHDYLEVVGSANAPYLNMLIATDGVLATNYFDSGTHPRLPNTLMMASGATQYSGGTEVGPTQAPFFPSSAENLGHQLTVAGIPWRAYHESMGTPCKLSASGNYVPYHAPFVYFDDIQNGAAGLCAATNVDYSSFVADLAAKTYRFSWIAPDTTHDGSGTTNPQTSLQAADVWLSTEVPKILASAVYQSSGVLFITFDQAEGRNGDDPDQVPMVVLSPALAHVGTNAGAAWSHATYLATVEDIFGLPRLAAASSAGTMTTLFAH